jgi:hypothetical protein
MLSDTGKNVVTLNTNSVVDDGTVLQYDHQPLQLNSHIGSYNPIYTGE